MVGRDDDSVDGETHRNFIGIIEENDMIQGKVFMSGLCSLLPTDCSRLRFEIHTIARLVQYKLN
ncbi:MAG TPA: hypothetical protein DEG47_30985 [Cyanobacteria bacterium UBA11148]|nr:hypothetical protein [Cyanobacteria bacterium UBA11148]